MTLALLEVRVRGIRRQGSISCSSCSSSVHKCSCISLSIEVPPPLGVRELLHISHIVVAHIEVPPPLGVTGWKSLGEVVAREGLLLLDWCIHLAFEQVEL